MRKVSVWEQDGRPGHSWGHASGEGRWCHGSAAGGPKKKASWLARHKPGARGRAAGRFPREAGGQRHCWWNGANQTPWAQSRASSRHWVSLDPLFWPHLEEIAVEPVRSCEASRRAAPGQATVGVLNSAALSTNTQLVSHKKQWFLSPTLVCLFFNVRQMSIVAPTYIPSTQETKDP